MKNAFEEGNAGRVVVLYKSNLVAMVWRDDLEPDFERLVELIRTRM